MKKGFSLLMAIFLLTATVAFGQLRKIPAEVTEAFKVKFPDAKNVSWSDKVTSFEASFEDKAEKLQASFSSKGEWKKTEKQLVVADIPAAIKDGLKATKFAEWTIKSAIEINDTDGKHEYRLVVEKSALQKKNVYFSPDGALIRDAVTL
jgi:hypothetical protein